MKGVVQPCLRAVKQAFYAARSYAVTNALHRRTQGRVLLPNVLAKLLEKYRYSSINTAVSTLKEFSASYTANLAHFRERSYLA